METDGTDDEFGMAPGEADALLCINLSSPQSQPAAPIVDLIGQISLPPPPPPPTPPPRPLPDHGLDHGLQAAIERLGATTLREFQQEALSAYLCGSDTLILAATGSGKSLCFQAPALLPAAAQKTVFVVSPLISLMRDQVAGLAQKGVPAVFLGSAQRDTSALDRVLAGGYRVCYVCPETLIGKVLPRLRADQVALFAIDECHCVSKWGHDFRPEYLR